MKRLLPSRYLILGILFSMGLSLAACGLVGMVYSSNWKKALIGFSELFVDLMELKPDDDGVPQFSRLALIREKLHEFRFGIWLVGAESEGAPRTILAGKDALPTLPIYQIHPLPIKPREILMVEGSASYYPHLFIRLPTKRPRWLWTTTDVQSNSYGVMRGLFFAVFGVTSITASFAAYLLLWVVFKLKSQEAKKVIAEFAKGNLQARLKQTSGESGELSRSFNVMASDIERMVTQIRNHESLRQRLVAELGHDLRTPLTAIRIALDSQSDESNPTPPTEARKLIGVARRELNYIQRLLEYLFVAAKAGEPILTIKMEKVDVGALIAAEVESLKALERGDGKHVEWKISQRAKNTEISSDRALTLRLLRNLLENGRRYAAGNVVVSIEEEEDELLISIFNDGKPIDSSSFKAATGNKLGVTSAESAAKSETSLGLGSAIVTAIADLHDWDLAIEARPTGTSVMLRIDRG